MSLAPSMNLQRQRRRVSRRQVNSHDNKYGLALDEIE